MKKIFLRKYRNQLYELLENDFNVMVIPTFSIFEGESQVVLKNPYLGNDYLCMKDEVSFDSFDTALYLKLLKENKCVAVVIKKVGTLLFTNHLNSDLFLVLQRKYRNLTNFVFKGNKTGGYFKILKNGRISRKIASYLIMEGIRNNPETRGLPCEYEIENHQIWKIDMKAKWMKDMLVGFTSKEVLDLFDYYVGMSKIRNENILDVMVFSIVAQDHGKGE